MSKVLVLYFSQSGDVRKMAEAVVRPMESGPAAEGFEIHWAEIQPVTPFPYPWRNVHKFFNVMPETVLNLPPDIRTPDFDPDISFDLIILAYSVWFLSPSQPIQAFFKSEQARVLDGAPVITVTVSRKMWQRASEKMKRHLKQANAIHLDNIAVTHQGSGWSTFVTTPRRLITGKKSSVLGLPEAGIQRTESERLEDLGEVIASRLHEGNIDRGPLLSGHHPAPVIKHNVIPELIGNFGFRFWAHFIRIFGKNPSNPLRHLGLVIFITSLILGILIALPLIILSTILVRPLFATRFRRYVAQLELPSGP